MGYLAMSEYLDGKQQNVHFIWVYTVCLDMGKNTLIYNCISKFWPMSPQTKYPIQDLSKGNNLII